MTPNRRRERKKARHLDIIPIAISSQSRANPRLYPLYPRAYIVSRAKDKDLLRGRREKKKGAGEKIIRIEDLIRFLKFENPAAGNVSKEGGRKW